MRLKYITSFLLLVGLVTSIVIFTSAETDQPHPTEVKPSTIKPFPQPTSKTELLEFKFQYFLNVGITGCQNLGL
jgi:hypothetical protein